MLALEILGQMQLQVGKFVFLKTMYIFLLLPLCDFRGVYEHEIVNNVLIAYEIIF